MTNDKDSEDALTIAYLLGVKHGRADQPTQSDADIIANERKAIAAWLRGDVPTDYTDPEYDIGRNLADAVERGAYLQEQSK
jgi:hypothetical protein